MPRLSRSCERSPPVASQDILAVRVERIRVDRVPAVRAVLTLAAAPDPAAAYYVSFGTTCTAWFFANVDPTVAGEPAFGRNDCTRNATLPDHARATIAIEGHDVVFTAKDALGLRPGQIVTAIEGRSAPAMSVTVFSPAGTASNGDTAYGVVYVRL